MSSASGEHHYNDETLVAYLDRELPEGERGAVEQHLGECWSCRRRAAEVEQDIHFVTRLVESESSRSGEEIKRGLHTFLARRSEFEARFETRSLSRRVLPRFWWPSLPWATAGAALAGALAVAILWHGSAEPQPAAIMRQAAASEQKLLRSSQPSHQVLQVQVRTPERAAAKDLGTLEIWSEPSAGARYSSRWTDPRSTLKHAVWRPSASAYSYDPDTRQAVACNQPTGTAHLADQFRDGADADSIERAFLKWMRRRAWTLVSFTEEWAAFADRTGVRVVVERPREGTGWRLSASRADRDRTFEMILQVDSRTWLPRAEAIRVSVNGRAAEISLTVERWQTVRPHELLPAVFTPAVSIAVTEPRLPLLPLLPRPAPLALIPSHVDLPEWALTDLELRVRWALHEAQQCVDVSVDRDHGAGIVVRPLLSDAVRRAALAHILGGIEGSNYIRIAAAPDSVTGPASNAAMIGKHARVLEEIVASASQLRGLSQPQERQLARLFADHRRALRVEMAHLRARLGEARPVPTEVADFPVPAGFLDSAEAREQVAAIRRQTAALAPDLESLDNALLSLETSMRRDHAARTRR